MGETTTAWGCSPLQQEEYKAFILQLGHLTREVPGHPGSSAYAPKEANGPGFMDSSLTRPIGPLSSSQCAERAQWKSAERECGKFQPHSDRQSRDSPGFSKCPRRAQWHRILTSGYRQLLPQTQHFPCPTCCHCQYAPCRTLARHLRCVSVKGRSVWLVYQ